MEEVIELGLLFIHFDQIDAAGHSFGFSHNVSQYAQAIRNVDSLIGEVLSSLRKRDLENEDWLILSSTDHGI